MVITRTGRGQVAHDHWPVSSVPLCHKLILDKSVSRDKTEAMLFIRGADELFVVSKKNQRLLFWRKLFIDMEINRNDVLPPPLTHPHPSPPPTPSLCYCFILWYAKSERPSGRLKLSIISRMRQSSKAIARPKLHIKLWSKHSRALHQQQMHARWCINIWITPANLLNICTTHFARIH